MASGLSSRCRPAPLRGTGSAPGYRCRPAPAWALAHEQVVGADVGLAFGAVHHQRMDLFRRARGELGRGGEAGAAETADAGRADAFEQRQRTFGAEVRAGMQLGPALQAVAGDDDGRRGKTGGMRIGCAPIATTVPEVGACSAARTVPSGRAMVWPAEYGLADFHARSRRRADVLAERHDVALRQRRLLDRQGGGALACWPAGRGRRGRRAGRSCRSLPVAGDQSRRRRPFPVAHVVRYLAHLDAVHRTGLQAQVATGAFVGDHRVHQPCGADDGVHRAGLDALGAADAFGLADVGYPRRGFLGGVERLGLQVEQVGEGADGRFAARRALVDLVAGGVASA